MGNFHYEPSHRAALVAGLSCAAGTPVQLRTLCAMLAGRVPRRIAHRVGSYHGGQFCMGGVLVRNL